jgi:hypothetical protein
MKSSEETIEKVLAGLGDAEAPAGMERRILDGLEERGVVRSGSGWRWWLPVWLVAPARPVAVGPWMCGVALAGIVVVALAVPAIRRLGQAPVQARRNSAPRGNSAPPGSPALAASEAASESAEHASLRSSVRSVEEMKTEDGINAENVADVVDGDSAALDDMHAASRPAPPMPLTEQERLLLLLVHKDAPVELAMLDSRMRALQDSEDKAEFQRFFAQSTKQITPEQPVTEQGAPPPSTTEQGAPGQSATEEAMPAEPGTDQAAPEQPTQELPVPEQPTQPQATPEQFAPDPSTTQQTTPRPTRTGENK